VPIADLRQDPQNARSHDRRNLDAIKESLVKFGQVLPVVVRDGQLVGGNATTQAALELGWTHLDATPADHLSAEEAVALAIALNRTAELASWDAGVLVDALAGLPTLEGTGFTAEELADLEAALGQGGPGAGLTDPDEVPEPPVEPVTRPGDLWLLGPHRLLCGDARDAEAVERLLAGERPGMLLMDPPYGINLDTDFSTIKGSLRSIGRAQGTQGNTYAPVIGDDEDYDPQPILMLFEDVAEQFWWGADYYADRIPDRAEGSWLVWDKRKESQAEAIGSEFELCWSRQRHKRRMLRHEWFGFLSSESAQEARHRVHPTQKPTALYADILGQWGKPGSLVLDLYAGSGTLAIACHQVGSRAALMELDPGYVDVACRRWQEHTGEKPILEATGEPHDFTSAP
jgi:DNA modification methylase